MKIHHFDGIYQERWGFSWAMLVYQRVVETFQLKKQLARLFFQKPICTALIEHLLKVPKSCDHQRKVCIKPCKKNGIKTLATSTGEGQILQITSEPSRGVTSQVSETKWTQTSSDQRWDPFPQHFWVKKIQRTYQ